MNYDDLLNQALNANKPKSFADILVEKTEQEFKTPQTNAETARVKEKEELLSELKVLRKKLTKTVNVKSISKSSQQTNKLISQKRKEINDKIEAIKDKLFVISEERLGAKIDPETLIKASADSLPSVQPEVSDWKSVY